MKKQKGLTLLKFIMCAAVFAPLALLFYEIFSDDSKERRASAEKAKQAQALEDSKPRKVSEANGCEVWAFKPGARWQYFTRCDTATTHTINTWEECRSVSSGKTTRQECTPHSTTVTQEPNL